MNWYIEGTLVNLIFATDQSRHRAFTHDNIDPTKPEFVAGSSQKEIESQKFFFEPIGSGLVNRDFKDVVPGEIYCYDNLTNIHGGQNFNTSILLEIPDENTLRLGKNNQNSCGSGPWSLINYTVYER